MFSAKKEWIVAGLMSGTSLDGLDIALCRFRQENENWSYEILDATTISYPASLKKKLAGLMKASAQELAEMDAFFGKYSGEQVKKFISNQSHLTDLIASHGHTIFHQPGKGFTTQIGNGAYLSAATGLPVVSDFRSMDVALGGQGAPLVPVGDKLLFSHYNYCLNLGGIANISYDHADKRIAGDICPVNIVLNLLAAQKGKAFDKDGKLAAKGKVNTALLKKLDQLSFYKKKFPKSLGREWVDKEFLPLIIKSKLPIEDRLATMCAHIAFQIAEALPFDKEADLLATGGGAFNTFLVEKIKEACGEKINIVVPDAQIVSYKEALVFAFLGLKRVLGEANVLHSVTGAKSNSVSGALYGEIMDYKIV
ncbi:MAG TPA: anhydro-N-acetylmuramic acid kinase [Cytophagaceae bacterium]|nr:anhydro-N-acetylmuramic acid kinase [Cytophagaceae bacterium]